MAMGAVFAKSTKQKLNTRSSTETKIVAVDDLMPDILWCSLFLENQEYKTKGTILHQDNTSTITWEEKGRQSLGKHAKHINVRYFFITDCIKKGELKVKYCPTAEMLGDFSTKPLQEGQFLKLRAAIMGK